MGVVRAGIRSVTASEGLDALVVRFSNHILH